MRGSAPSRARDAAVTPDAAQRSGGFRASALPHIPKRASSLSSRCIRRPNEYAMAIVRRELGGLGTAQALEQPAAVAESDVGHPVAGMQAPERLARGQGARAVVEGELVSRRAALERSRLVQALAQAEYRGGDGQTLGLVGIEHRVGATPRDMCELPAEVIGILPPRIEPWPPAGGWRCAASPARNTRPTR